MIFGMGNVMGQMPNGYDSSKVIAVKNDSGNWNTDIWKNVNAPFPVSKLNYQHQSVSGIGGDSICMQLVDTLNNPIGVWRWIFVNSEDIIINVTPDTSVVYYVLPLDTIYFETINAYYDAADSTKYITISVWSKFLPPTLEITDTINSMKSSSIELTLADFGLEIAPPSYASSDTAYYESIDWYRNGVLIYEGTGDDTTFIDSDSLETGNYYSYSVKVKVAYVTVFYANNVPFYETFYCWKNSDSLSVLCTSMTDYALDKTSFNVYPNPATDYLYFSEETEYSVFSIAGKEIAKGFGKEINVTDFDSGTYVLITPTINKKFIVQK